ncbi:MAG TPA: hypothetical protein V6C65_04605 [Allocoleopsis sp.]
MSHETTVLGARIANLSDREYLLYIAGIEGLYHLGEKDVPGLYLTDATPEEVLDFVAAHK